MSERLIEPLKFYKETAAALHWENTEKHFEELVKRSGVDRDENRATVKAYKQEKSIVEETDRKLSKYKLFRGLLITAVILAGLAVVMGIYLITEQDIKAGLVSMLVGAAVFVVSLLVVIKKLNPIIKDNSAIREKHAEKAAEHLKKAEAQMAPLNALFDSRDTFRLIEKTLPEISFDDRYTKENEELFQKQYDFALDNEGNSSVVDTLSGRFSENPFLFCRRLFFEMGSHTYHGTLVIHWTETYTDSQGKTKTRTRSQTLHASVTKPKPLYYYNNCLCYGNQAAPDLSFSRTAQHVERLSEKDVDRKVRRGERKLKKRAERAVNQGGSFQEMANSDFDVLFGAIDRNNEVQFRLMYTPLAQQNTVALLRSGETYGDDFAFRKRRRFNMITSEHSQGIDLQASVRNYVSYDIDDARIRFINYNCEYFKSVYFDFAPLLSVPAYHDEPSFSMEYMEEYPTNFTFFEHEVMANAIGADSFAHEETVTDVLLKTSFLVKNGKKDAVTVNAHSFKTIPRVDYVSVLGGDGHFHNVPVYWDEYIPLLKTSQMGVCRENDKEVKRAEGSIARFHGLASWIE